MSTNNNTILRSGDWVLYNGKPRQVRNFTPYDYPELGIEPDPRFDMAELSGIKKPVYVRNVRVMRVEEESRA